MTAPPPPTNNSSDKQNQAPALDRWLGLLALAYFPLYFTYLYLFVHFENELTHWLTLVLLPLALVILVIRLITGHLSVATAFRRVGLARGSLKRGVGWALVIGLTLGLVFQLLLSRQSDEIWASIQSGRFLYAFPLAFLLMLFTAGFTEEFYFRGVLQTNLRTLFRSHFWSIVVSAILFGLYHFPYAYLLETWGSHGSVQAALSEGVAFSAVMGLVLGLVYARFGNLLVPVIVHSMFNGVMAVTMLKGIG